jgi:predicted CopG family antitoxin
MSKSVRISDEDYKILLYLKNKERWNYQTTVSEAIRFFAKAKRVSLEGQQVVGGEGKR